MLLINGSEDVSRLSPRRSGAFLLFLMLFPRSLVVFDELDV